MQNDALDAFGTAFSRGDEMGDKDEQKRGVHR